MLKKILSIIALITLFESLSFLGYLFPQFNQIAFIIIFISVLILSIYNLEYGLYIAFAELFISSKGYLFYFTSNGLIVSIRIALWIIIMSVWLSKIIIKAVRDKKITINSYYSSYSPYILILFIFIIWGFANGILKNNGFNNIFFDFNNWLYFLLFFPLAQISTKPNFTNNGDLSQNKFLKNLWQIFLASISWITLETFILLFLFSHSVPLILPSIYKWIRTSGVGEITLIKSGFYRIFFQVHIFELLAIFIFLFFILNLINNHQIKTKKFLLKFTAYCLLLSDVIISFSRSFWLGFIIGLLLLITLSFFKYGIKKTAKFASIIFIGAIVSTFLVFIIVKFPYPKSIARFNPSLLQERAQDVKSGKAISSRWNLLPLLLQEIEKAPILGQGFGKTITYKSNDPRIVNTTANSMFTTYAFEWGWLDIWLKLGIFGMIAYLILLYKLISLCLKVKLKSILQNYLVYSMALGIIILAVVNFFTPYLNHPLGIGYILLYTVTLLNCYTASQSQNFAEQT